MARIRVLRLMEYEYPDYESMDSDMSRWQVPAISTRRFGDKAISSAIIAKPFDQEIDDENARTVEKLVIEALQEDGSHHKQFYLEQIAQAIGLDPRTVDHERGIAP